MMKQLIYLFLSVCISPLACGLQVYNFYGEYNPLGKQPGRPAASLDGPYLEQWTPSRVAQKPYKIGVLVPHLNDHYWRAINFGLVEQAKKLGVTLKIYSAGDYSKIAKQRLQLADILPQQDKVNGIIIGSIFYDKLDKFVATNVERGIPVVAMVNDIHAPKIQGKVLVSFLDVGEKIGELLLQDSGRQDIRIAILPGPKQAKWATDTVAGMTKAFKESPHLENWKGKITIVAESYTDMGVEAQEALLTKVLTKKPDINYLVVNAVAAKLAPGIIEKLKDKHPNIKVIATYMLPEVYEYVTSGDVYAAVSDFTVDQGKMALDVLVRILNGDKPGDRSINMPFRTGPEVVLINKSNIDQYKYEQLFGAKDFEVTLEYTE